MTDDTKPPMVVDKAALLPYGTNLSAPSFTLPDVKGFKEHFSISASHKLTAKYEEIKREYDQLVQSASDNQMIYSARFNFKPVAGRVYFLYNTSNDGKDYMLSLIGPHQWSKYQFIGSFRYASDSLWERVDE
jgi:hypothetical protein